MSLSEAPSRGGVAPLVLIAQIFLVVGLCWPADAVAEESGADALFRQGVRALRAGRYDDAASLFRLSYQMERRAATMCNLALTYERAGRDREALESYRQCAEDDTEGRFRDHALERARDLERRLGARPEPLALSPTRQPVQQPVVQQPAQQQYQQPYQQQYEQPTQRRRVSGVLWGGLASLVLGLGGIGTAIGLHSWASGVYDDLESQYGYEIEQGSAAEDRMERGASGVSAAIALYAVGGVLTGLGAVLMLVGAARTSRNRGARVGFAPTEGGGMLSVSFQLPAF